MITLRPMLSFMLLGTLSVVAMSCSTVEQTPTAEPDRSADEAAIRAKIAENEAATNRLDATAVAATFAEDADIIIGDPPRITPRIAGRDAIHRAIATGYSTAPHLEARITIESIRFLSADVAIAECLGVHRYSTGDVSDRATFVMVRRDEGWLISAVRVLPVVPPETDRTADEAAIHALLAENEAATNRRDAAGVAATFTPDADLWIASGPRFQGVDEIQRNEEKFYATPGFREWHATVESLRFIASDVAIVEQAVTTTFDSGDIHENTTVVVARNEAVWKMAAVRVMGQGQ